MSKTENTLHKKTPSVTVLSNRGQVVRDIVYHRHPDTPEKTDERITCHQFDKRGFLEKSADPRMQASGLSNFCYITSLSGQVLRTESADAGISLTLNDAAGRPVISISQIRTDNGQDDRSRAVTQTFRYEGADSAGRPLSIAEQTAGQKTQVTERFVYAGSSEAEKAKNLAGICTHHYDPAGLMQTDSIALTGVPLSVTRQLLKDADNPDIAVNWPESNPESLLSAEKYTTQTTADATGAVLNTTDAAGHQQKVTYDIAGLLSTSRVTVKGGAEKIIIKSVTYSAAGQKLREEHGNGVVTTYTYEPQTQRLLAVKTEHPARKKIFQDLRYEYDPVGNVLCVTNSAEETRFWHNQKVVPENRYTYDTLYQLVSATGREMANAGQQSSSLPDISPFDKASYTNYTRNYTYDRAGNMTQIRHSAPVTGNNYTTDITVSQRSNRAVLKTLADTPEKAEALFTPGGQQTQLQPGQELSWTARGELQLVTPVVRSSAAGDCESYRYDAGSQRILKTTVQKTGNSSLTQQVIYLPGLELYRGKENYQVICAGVAGRAQVRLLHWPDGKKDHQRFSYDNLIGSSGLETDGDGKLLSQEEYYPFGGTAVLVAGADSGIDYKTHRYSGKERDATGLYYYGYRYYQPWAGRWLSSDPAGTVDGLNLFRMVRNNPVTLYDNDGRAPETPKSLRQLAKEVAKDFRRYTTKDVQAYMGGIGELGGHAFAAAHEKTESQIVKMSKKQPGTEFGLTLDKMSSIVTKQISNYKPANSYDAEPAPVSARDRSGLIGVPVYGSADKFSAPLERDINKNEILYRTIPEAHYSTLVDTGKLSATTETSVSPALAYSEGYDGVLVRFTLKEGTIAKLADIGGAVNDPAAKRLGLKPLGAGWNEHSAGFKTEGNQMTIHLGKGKGLDTFNDNIVTYHRMKKRERIAA
ncbi:RHS repeat protein [Morganella morganii]|uniref:RHS repeat protein n=1 Tax=Morganella morganii TaxID=582 RepID=UPI001E362F97|nr:RHS repeat domain-containing protein [Morganella morganii]